MSENQDIYKKRIINNTLLLYVRMLFVMVVGLFTSRIVLQALGVDDYGIYNVVGGFVSMLAFINSSLSNATQRFINIALGKNNQDQAILVFNQSLILYILLAFFIIIFGEIIGSWYVNTKLVVNATRLFAANWCLQFSLLAMFVAIIQIPYMSVIIAREKMNIFARLSIIEVTLKLIMVYVLLHIESIDKLILYSALMAISQIIIAVLYILYASNNIDECTHRRSINKKMILELSRFIGYNAIGSLSWSAGFEGINIILNLFFGPAVNAARAISNQVSCAVYGFISQITTAVRPQIVQNYSSGNMDDMKRLILYSSKYNCLLMVLISLPVIINIDFILKLWLTTVPKYTNTFVILMLIEATISSLISPLWISANATGKIRNQSVYGRFITLAALPIAYFSLKFKIIESPNYVLMLLVIANAFYWFFCFFDTKKQIALDLVEYVRIVIKPLLIVFFTTFCCVYLIKRSSHFGGFIEFFFLSITSVVCMLVSLFILGLTNNERSYIKKGINNKLKYKHAK